MTESERIEQAGAEVAPLSGIAKWLNALARAVLRPRARRSPDLHGGVPQPVSTWPLRGFGLVTPPVELPPETPTFTVTTVPACQSTEATAEAAVEKSLARNARKRPKLEGKTMAKKQTKRPKSKAKRVLPVLLVLLVGLALATTACGVALPKVTFAPLDPKMAGGEMPSVTRAVTTADGVVLGGGSFFINPAAMLLELGKFTGSLVSKLGGKPPVVVAPGPVAGEAGPKAGGV